MRITVSQLRRIIKEEVSRVTRSRRRLHENVGKAYAGKDISVQTLRNHLGFFDDEYDEYEKNFEPLAEKISEILRTYGRPQASMRNSLEEAITNMSRNGLTLDDALGLDDKDVKNLVNEVIELYGLENYVT